MQDNQQSSTTSSTTNKARSARPTPNSDQDSSRSSTLQSAQKTGESNGSKSVGTVIAESLAKDTQESVDRVMSQVTDYFESGKTYLTENPREAAALAVTLGMAAWALLYTQPGRQLFDKSAAVAVPKLSKWLTQNFNGSKA